MKKMVPFLMIALAAVTIAAVYSWQALRDVRTQARELAAHISAMPPAGPATVTAPGSAAVPSASAPVVASASAATQAGPSTSPGPAPAVAATPDSATAARAKQADPLQGLAQQMLSTPEGQEMMKAQLRAILPMQFPDIGKELGLTPAETEKLLDMIVSHQLSIAGDALNVLGGSQDPAAARESARKVEEKQRANQAELAALLGDRMPKYEQYQRTLPLRQQVNQLKAALGTGNNALSDEQGRQLIATLAAEQTLIQQDRRNAPRPVQQGPANPQVALEQQLARAAEDNRRMLNAARSQLNSQQLDSYRQMLEQQQELQRMLRSMGTQGAGNTPPAPAPGPY